MVEAMAEDDSEREKPAFILIDPPVGPYSGGYILNLPQFTGG